MGEPLYNIQMYALIISTNRRNKEPKKDQEKTKKQIQRNKTKPGQKIIKHKKSQKEESLEVLFWGGCYVWQDLRALLLLWFFVFYNFLLLFLFCFVIFVSWFFLGSCFFIPCFFGLLILSKHTFMYYKAVHPHT